MIVNQIDPLCLNKIYKVLIHYRSLSRTKANKLKKGYEKTEWIIEWVEKELLKV